jgi:SAM-dependent methyltransferase
VANAHDTHGIAPGAGGQLDEFERGGFARLAHFRSPVWARHKEELERTSAAFGALAWRDGTHGYFWPLDPLHWWSRIWEYPFFAAQLSRLTGDGGGGGGGVQRPRLLDVGAAVISRGLEVLSMDYDPTMPAHFARAYTAVAPAMGLPSGLPPYLVADARDTRLPDASFDVVTSVSVLEHIPQWERAIAEMMRVLRPGGHLVLTLDVKRTPVSSGFTLEELSHLIDQVGRAAHGTPGRSPDAPDRLPTMRRTSNGRRALPMLRMEASAQGRALRGHRPRISAASTAMGRNSMSIRKPRRIAGCAS